MEDVLLDGGSNVNIIIKDFIKKFEFLLFKSAPYNLHMAIIPSPN
jgi:hypothetical protein